MWNTTAIIVMVLATAMSVAVVASIIGLAVWGKTVSEVGGEVMIAIFGAMVAIIAGYVARNSDRKEPLPPPKDEVDKDGET